MDEKNEKMQEKAELTPVKLLGCDEEEESPDMGIPPIIVTGGIFKISLHTFSF